VLGVFGEVAQHLKNVEVLPKGSQIALGIREGPVAHWKLKVEAPRRGA
jgi:hypothetical protein